MPARQPPRRDDPPHARVPARPERGAVAAVGDRDRPRLSTQLERVPGGVLVLDADLRVRDANAAMAAMVGAAAESLVGRSFEALLTTPGRLLFQTHVYPALLTEGRVEEMFLTLAGGDGEPVPILLNVERGSGDPEPDGYVALAVRIRARSRWEQELLAATRALEAERVASRKLADDLEAAARDLRSRHADEARSREFRDAFVGVVSHELRTPITTIFGMSHVLRGRHATMDPEAVSARLDDIATEADRLRRLTEDLLVLSRAEAGRLEVAFEPLVIGHVVRGAVRDEESRAAGHRFELVVEPMLPLVQGEATYVEQVVRNFLSNAVKYSPGGTTIRTTATPEDGGVAVRVVDEGPGLGDGVPEELWDLFYRTKRAIKQTAGAGIGLFVSKALIEAMAGRVWARAVDEVDGSGAEFAFWLPGAAAPDEE
ncbi:MAG TPA: ATP-binding protein [Candidatus Limnocylindrales bacterium]|nr:ATP-binding protein [Candidatus Limnocylindrales bacterium]